MLVWAQIMPAVTQEGIPGILYAALYDIVSRYSWVL